MPKQSQRLQHGATWQHRSRRILGFFRVAVARKLAGILPRIWRDGAEFRWGKEVPLAA